MQPLLVPWKHTMMPLMALLVHMHARATSAMSPWGQYVKKKSAIIVLMHASF